MRILLVSHELGASGAPRALLNMASILRDLHHHVEVISPYNGALYKEFESVVNGIRIAPSLFTEGEEVELEYFNSFDVVVLNTIVSLALSQKINGINGKIICWVHEGKAAYNLFAQRGCYGRKTPFNFKELFKLVDSVYCVSEYSKKLTKIFTDKEIYILPYYLDECISSKPKRMNKKFTIGCFGTLEPRKGIDILNAAIDKLDARLQENIDVIVCGAESMPINGYHHLKYIGKLSHKALIDCYKMIDLLVCPSLDDPLPMTVCEAFANKCPVLVSEYTGFYNIIEDTINGLVCKYDVDDLAKSIEYAYNNQNKLEKIGLSGHMIYLSKFTKENFENNLKQIFND